MSLKRVSRRLCIAAAAFVAAAPAFVQAQETGARTRLSHARTTTAAESSDFNTGRVSLSLGVDFATAYFFPGLNQEDSGFIGQPWAEVGFNLYRSEGVVNSVDFSVGTWNSLHSQETMAASGNTVPPWFESDAYFSLSSTVFDDWTVSLTYTALTGPSSAFTTIHELGGTITYNDAKWWDRFGLTFPGFEGFQPYVTVIGELEGQADTPSTGGDEGVYLEVGVEPSLLVCEPIDLRLSVPMTAGMSIDNYYEDFATGENKFFGYFDIGTVFSMPLSSIIPADYSTWQISAGVHVLFLGDTAEGFSNATGSAWNNGDDVQVIGVLSLAMNY